MDGSQTSSSHSSRSSDTFELEKGDVFSEYKVMRKLNTSRYVTYLVSTQNQDKSYLLKLFKYLEGKPSLLFRNEARLANLSHKHLLHIIKSKQYEEHTTDSRQMRFSYILTEVPSHGEFFSLITRHNFPKDEILVRTYFHQLIEGLNYLHDHGVAHMDLKLENLVIDEDYNLKIANLNCSILGEEIVITSNGSDNCRAPEIKRGALKDPFQADIYSAGVILFILGYQNFPYIMEGPEEMMDNFWDSMCGIYSKQDKDMADLIKAMVAYNPYKRISLENIQASSWYQGKIYSTQELKNVMSSYFFTVVKKDKK